MMFVGADGCKKGWFAVQLADVLEWKVEVFEDIEALWTKYHNAAIILIDIPIGLKDEGPDERECDVVARKILGNKMTASTLIDQTHVKKAYLGR